MDVSTPPSLDSACPQAKAELGKQDKRFIEWSVDNEEYEHEASHYLNKHLCIINSNLFSYNFSKQMMEQLHGRYSHEKLIEHRQTLFLVREQLIISDLQL